MLNDALPWLDIRPREDFERGHFARAVCVPWTLLQQCLNALPAPPAKLNLLAKAEDLAQACEYLAQKGYQLGECLSDSSPLLLAGLPISTACLRLWTPNPLLTQVCAEGLLRGKTALDLGCGGGREAVFLAQQGWQVCAMDNQPRVLQCAQYLASSEGVRVDWRCADLREAGQRPDGLFDLILIMRFLNRDLFAYIRNHLAPGGQVLIQTFCEGVELFGSPKNPNFILKRGELAKEFAAFEVIVDKIESLADGRPVASFLARRPKGEEDARDDRERII
jgi:2-polyprenyl-3-methyl-5-hydroxy-6-metoxy-1,4-benzoquinol methylase